MERNLIARAVVTLVLASCVPVASAAVAVANNDTIEEIIVTARQQAETLQDVPVTISALTEEDLKRYNITTLTEASKLIPNFMIFHGGSGNGSNLILRGLGSSSISAAFDQSVAVNIDGVVVNIGRFIHNAYMDMGQIEVLKGPQSLYFGKSTTAGVVSITTKDPGDEFEMEGMVGYETEHDQTYYEAIVSGPVTDTFGARLAVGRTDSNELFKNLTPGVVHPYRGERSDNARLTLLWEPSDEFRARFKYNYSKYENNGANGRTEEICPEGTVQPTAIPAPSVAFVLFPGVDDCKLNGNTSIADLQPELSPGLPYGGADGTPFLDQQTDLYSLQLDWNASDTLILTSVTGYADLDHIELDIYDYNAGVFGGLHRNTYESLSQELRLASDFDSPFNFMAGLFYQDIEQTFEAYQYAFNLSLVPNFLNFSPATQPISAALGFDTTPGVAFGQDPSTGKGSDYTKIHSLDTKVYSAFVAGYWDVTDALEITAGVRYTKEEKDGKIDLPYFHAGAQLFGFGGFDHVSGLKFDDNDWSPEVAVNYYLTDDISLFASYKQGYKSGGIDNSALPTNVLNPNDPAFTGFDFLTYDSETAEGGEFGVKTSLLEGTMRFNASAFLYEYTDLQVQLFNSNTIQFETFNASQLRTTGIEGDVVWVTPLDGLTLRGALALTDTIYSDDFINATGENLEGQDGALSTDLAGFAGLTYDFGVGADWRMSFSFDARYNNGYPFSATRNAFEQDSYWLTDAALTLYSADGRWELSAIARNFGDEIVAQGAGARPGACVNADPANPNPAARCFSGGANDQDQVTTTTLGREFTLQVRVRL